MDDNRRTLQQATELHSFLSLPAFSHWAKPEFKKLLDAVLHAYAGNLPPLAKLHSCVFTGNIDWVTGKYLVTREIKVLTPLLRELISDHRPQDSQRISTTIEELDAFLWLTLFLRRFIPGRSDRVLTLKTAYLELVVDPKPPKCPPGHAIHRPLGSDVDLDERVGIEHEDDPMVQQAERIAGPLASLHDALIDAEDERDENEALEQLKDRSAVSHRNLVRPGFDFDDESTDTIENTMGLFGYNSRSRPSK
ncbi:hypothetical protein CFD26_101902 [Aspergillus turcosus]|uniref:Uncharacterized protein n=1 Tax=Aspergillus turcosus TaxID=1245748 RepID=A0A421CTK2_9EURO|nr:hypothetical protein CFD26_101902 [Aspergillus turcosus]